jgi:putative heme transporter
MADESAEQEAAERERGRVSRILFNRRVVKIVGILLVLGLLYYAFFVLLPSEIDWSAVWADLKALSAAQLGMLFLAGMLAIVALGWTSRASLPGLSLYQGTESSVTSQLSAFAFPPPADMAIRFGMYRTYGFTDEASGVAVLIAMVARYLMVVVMPVLGLALVLATGQAGWTALAWFVGLGGALALVLWLILRVSHSEPAAHATGRVLQRVATRVIHLFHRTPPTDLEDSVVRFGARIGTSIDRKSIELSVSNLAWGFSNALVMGLCLRYSGVGPSQVSDAAVVLTTGLIMALNMLPIPGKDALAVTWIAGVLGLSGSATLSDLGTALLLYRVVTWILPMPVGLIAFFAWRFRVRRDAVEPDVEPDVEPVSA